ncbi:class F sortase [Brevibacillus daliensis]|uniref:class F sortase n=1 Tax=Brevibacillus daliensis TaxID=2892995 RepID=UPI001E412F7B|nr:class F sortase [Brevibacillus daliensis]
MLTTRTNFLVLILAFFVLTGCYSTQSEKLSVSKKETVHTTPNQISHPITHDKTINKAIDQTGKIDQISKTESLQAKSLNIQSNEIQTGMIPVELSIPAIYLRAPIEAVGVTPQGNMAVPKRFDTVGILSPWTKPGQNGNVVIAGHYDHYTGPAVFYRLKKLQQGDNIYVSDRKGKRLQYVVQKVESYKTADAPLEKIFGDTDQAQLNLITCSGSFNKKTQEHAKRLVVYSVLKKN